MAVAGRSYASVPIISRGSLEDPADFGSRTRVLVVASQPDRRWLAVRPVTLVANRAAPAATAAATPGPVVVASQPPWRAVVQAFTARNTLQDPPVLTTAGPVVVAAAPDRRWLTVTPAMITRSPQAQPTATPGPAVVAAQPPWPRTVQAVIVRGALADPPVLTTRAPVVVAAAPDRRWFAVSPARIAAGAAAVPPAPPATGLLMVSYI